MIKKPFYYYYIMVVFIIIFTNANCATINIKIAFLDSFGYQNYVTTKYRSYYEEGINLAKSNARNKGLELKTKIFQYDNSNLSIFEQLDAIKKWEPDLIIGPRDSNHFLMIKNKVSDTLVLSPFATSSSISKMGSNFYSMSYNDIFTSKLYKHFIRKHFPGKYVKIISNAECKSCLEVGLTLNNLLSNNSSLTTYLESDFSNFKINELISDKNSNIYILHNEAHSSAILMGAITEHTKKHCVFIGGDGWGQWHDTEVGKISSNEGYDAYHITPWSIEKQTEYNRGFFNLYQSIYSDPPKNKLTFIIYKTLEPILNIVNIKDKCSSKSIRSKILCTFKDQIKFDYNKFKYPEYFVFKIHNKKQSLYDIINVNNYEK